MSSSGAARHSDWPKRCASFSADAYSHELSPSEQISPCSILHLKGPGAPQWEALFPLEQQLRARAELLSIRVVLGVYEAGLVVLTTSSLLMWLADEEGAVGLRATSWCFITAYSGVMLVSFSFESQEARTFIIEALPSDVIPLAPINRVLDPSLQSPCVFY